MYFDSTYLKNTSGIGRESRSNLRALEGMKEHSVEIFDPFTLLTLSKWLPVKLLHFLLGFKLILTGKPTYFRLPKDCDVVFQTHVNYLIPECGDYKFVLRLHDIFPVTNPTWFKWYSVRKFHTALKECLIRANFICDSNYTLDELVRFANQELSAKVAYCLVESLESTHCSNCDFCTRKCLPSNYYLAIGTVEPRKNYDYLLNEFQEWELEKPTLIICGKLGWKSKKLAKRIDTLCQERQVIWFRNVCDGGILSLMTASMGLVSATFSEGFNLPVSEAILAGIPTFISKIPVHLELYTSSNFFSTEVPGSLKSATQQRTQDPKVRPAWLNPDRLKENFSAVFNESIVSRL